MGVLQDGGLGAGGGGGVLEILGGWVSKHPPPSPSHSGRTILGPWVTVCPAPLVQVHNIRCTIFVADMGCNVVVQQCV